MVAKPVWIVSPPICQDCHPFQLQDLVFLPDYLLIHMGFGLVVKRMVLIISSGKITALFQAIASVRPSTFKSGFQGCKVTPIFIPADGLRIH